MSWLRDDAWFQAHEDDLMRDYAGQLIAVRGEAVVAAGSTLREVNTQLFERYGQQVYALVRKVRPESFGEPGEAVQIVL